jgi:hypothetical protein
MVCEQKIGGMQCECIFSWLDCFKKKNCRSLDSRKPFGKRKILNVTIEKLRPIFDKIFTLGDYFNQDCNLNLDLTKKDQLILYGEFILPGTTSSKHNIFENKRNGFKVGQMYSFGNGFVFENKKNQKIN